MKSKRTSIRIPTELYTWLVKRAESERRTVSNLIMALLEQVRANAAKGTDRGTDERG